MPGSSAASTNRSPSRPAGSRASRPGESEGFGVRVLVDGAWGFASSHILTHAPRRTASPPRPCASPSASATALREPVELDDRPPATGHVRDAGRGGPVRGPARAQDRRPARRRRGRGAGSRASPSPSRCTRPSASGRPSPRPTARTRSRRSPTSGRPSRPTPSMATSTSAAPTPTRAAAGRRPATSTSARLGLEDRAEPLADEAVALLTAPQCPSGRFTIVLDPSQLYLQVHESCGHPTELDRVFGTEASYAGTSFLTTDKLDEGFRYGSDLIDIVADATAPGGMGTFGWDDEGVAAQAVPLVQNGIFVGYLSQPRDGAADRAAERRRDAGGRLEPHPAHPHDEHQPAAQARDEPRRDRRRHRRRPVPRLEPLAGRSTTGGSTSSSPPRSPTRSRAARRAGCSRTRRTPASPTSSGARATRSATSGAT